MAYKKNKSNDPRGKFAQVFHSVVETSAFYALSRCSRAVYLELRLSLGQNNNGDISATLTDFKRRGAMGSATLSKALDELQTLGFIDKTRQGGIAANGKNCSLYRFTDTLVHAMPPKGIPAMKATHEYKAFKSTKEAKAAFANSKSGAYSKRDAERATKKRADKNKSKVLILNPYGSDSESTEPFIGSDSEHERRFKVQILNLQNIDLPPFNPNEIAAFSHFGCTLQ